MEVHTCNPAPRRLRHEDIEFFASLGFTVRACLELSKQRNRVTKEIVYVVGIDIDCDTRIERQRWFCPFVVFFSYLVFALDLCFRLSLPPCKLLSGLRRIDLHTGSFLHKGQNCLFPHLEICLNFLFRKLDFIISFVCLFCLLFLFFTENLTISH